MIALLGIALLVVLVIGGIGGDNLTALIDPLSFLIVVVLAVAGLMASFGPRHASVLRIFFGKDANLVNLRYAVAVCDRARSYSVAGGVLGTLIGCMLLLHNMDDPARLGPGMALMLLTNLYALILAYGILLPCSLSLKRRLDELEEGARE